MRSLKGKEMIKGKIDENIVFLISIGDISHEQAECAVTKHIYGSKFEKNFPEKVEMKILEQFFENKPAPGIGWD